MGTRELIILLLGLAVVGVILRGLYIAMRSRRGQIRLAIEKNIPQDVDLDALEMAELPRGGARVIQRGLREVNRQNRQSSPPGFSRGDELDLDGTVTESGPVPVLMDAVELKERRPESSTSNSLPHVEQANASRWSNGDDDDDWDEGTDDDDEDGDEDDDDFESDDLDDEDLDEDDDDESDDDTYDDDVDEDDESTDDYEEDDEEDDEDDFDEDDDYDYYEEGEEPDYYDEGEELDYYDEGDEPYNKLAASASQKRAKGGGRVEPTLDTEEAFENSLDDFSITPGDRIGAVEKASPKSAPKTEQVSLFEEPLEDELPSTPARRRGLFSRLGNRAGGPSLAERFTGKLAEKSSSVDEEGDEIEDILLTPKERSRAASTPGSSETSSAGSAKERRTRSVRSARTPVRAKSNLAEKPQEEPTVSHADAKPQLKEIEPSEVLVINVMAKPGREIHGQELLQVLITSGLKFGDMKIFHQRLDNSNRSPVVFSVANILNPGTFDLNNMDQFTTQGVSLFLALPTPMNNLLAFEQMLKVAQQIRGALDAELKDDHRNVLTAQTIEHYRQRVRDFELRQLKAASMK